MSAKGRRLGFQYRESSQNELLTAESKLLRCHQVDENARWCALFSILLRRTRKTEDWVAERGDSTPPRPFQDFELPEEVWPTAGCQISKRAAERNATCLSYRIKTRHFFRRDSRIQPTRSRQSVVLRIHTLKRTIEDAAAGMRPRSG